MAAVSASAVLLTLIVTLLGRLVAGDYTCVCTYDVEKKVYEQPSTTSRIIGAMYEFDCKPEASGQGANSQWTAVAFQNQVGYIQTSQTMEVQTCQGDPPPGDRLTSTVPSATTTTMASTSMVTTEPTTTAQTTPIHTTAQHTITTTSPTPPTTVPSTTTLQSTKTAAILTTTPIVTNAPYVTYGCSQKYIDLAHGDRGTLFTFEHTCYEVVPHHVTWSQAEHDCVQKGGHLAHVSNSSEQNAIYEVVEKLNHHSVWIGLNDRDHEERFQWTSGDPVHYTHWYPGRYTPFGHFTQDCVVMAVGNWHGAWEDLRCGSQYGYVCEFGAEQAFLQATATPTPDINTDGNIQLCPQRLINDANTHGNHVAQYGTSCYELGTQKHSYHRSEYLCTQRGGHLVDVTSANEQAFIQAFTNRYTPKATVWIGFNDLSTEGNFGWTSGAPVTYTHWLPGHEDNFQSHHQEDCTVFLPFQAGYWDDVTCGESDPHTGDTGEIHYGLCEFPISIHSPSSGSSLHNGAVLVG